MNFTTVKRFNPIPVREFCHPFSHQMLMQCCSHITSDNTAARCPSICYSYSFCLPQRACHARNAGATNAALNTIVFACIGDRNEKERQRERQSHLHLESNQPHCNGGLERIIFFCRLQCSCVSFAHFLALKIALLSTHFNSAGEGLSVITFFQLATQSTLLQKAYRPLTLIINHRRYRFILYKMCYFRFDVMCFATKF